MHTIISNNYLHSPKTRVTPLVFINGEQVVLDSLFITDAKYTKYLVPVIKIVDRIHNLKRFLFR